MALSDEELQELYSSKYFEGEEYLDYEKEGAALQRNFIARLRDLSKWHRKDEHLWEIGAAYGFFLKAASRRFRVAGCDISEHAAEYARNKLKQSVQAVDFLQLPQPDKPFDIVCLWDTVEHLRDPQLYLQKAAAELRSGGTLALSTGDIGSAMARWRGEKWRLIHPPTHLHYFSTRSMTTLLKRAGFQEVRVRHPPFWRSADAVAYRLLAHPAGRVTESLYHGLRGAGLLKFSFPFNTWDLMTVYATK